MRRLLVFLLVQLLLINSYAQDLTGTWEGSLAQGDNDFSVTIYLVQIAGDIYKGAVQIKEKKPIKITGNGRLNIPKVLEKKSSATINLTATLSNGQLQVKEEEIVEKDGPRRWRLELLSFRHSTNSGNEQLYITSGYNGDLVKKSSDYPPQYAAATKPEPGSGSNSPQASGAGASRTAAAAKPALVSLDSVIFTNSAGSSDILFNDKGTLAFTFTNNSEVNLASFDILFNIKEENTGIQGTEGKVGTMSLPKFKTDKGGIYLVTGYNLISDSIHFTIEGMYKGAALFTRDFALATKPFFTAKTTTVGKSSDITLNALAGYYGFGKKTWATVVTPLNALAATGNKPALMWKAVFTTLGWGGYPPNENEGVKIAKQAFPAVQEAARAGDAECQYLMFYAIGMGIAGVPNKEAAKDFLQRAADAGFLPAMYDYGLFQQKAKQYEEGLKLLESCYAKGLQKAALNIGFSHRKGFVGDRDSEKAIEWYKKGEAFGDPANLMQLAFMYTDGEDIEPNALKAMQYAKKAADMNYPDALNFMAGVYLRGKEGVPKNPTKALELLKQAAGLGDQTAMTTIAYLYLGGVNDAIPKDDKTSFFWAKKAAESGGAEAMALLGNMYEEGKVIEKNTIKARFWTNQAYNNGVGQRDNNAERIREQEMSNIISGIDFSDHYSLYRTSDGDIVGVNEGSDPLGSLFASTIGTALSRRMSQQKVINGLEYIYTKGGKKIYGGTLTSTLTTDITLKKGQQVKVNSYGTVNLGTFAGVSTPNGIYGFQSYSLIQSIPHAAIIGGVNKKWVFFGTENIYTASEDGALQIAINDADYSNNAGYFDCVIEVL
ncbi:tetratricopeptide repeat protein [Paraflavitalea pollutisoli]|uniref:tetratricopeptide repeat protein n=1 Tax=Paraflavitalea pollutisoli TaxID=3034143 RepID=UPI0023ED437C|nr:tetratricopeptide repeat protein [Paraflavitalea sp. H1-2-19X]